MCKSHVAAFIGLAVSAAAFSAATASADTIQATFNDITPGQGVNFTLGANNSSTTAGVFNWTRTGGTYSGPGPSVGDPINSFCIELTQYISYGGSYTYNVVELKDASLHPVGMGQAKADMISALWGQHHSDSMTIDEAAAFQISVWEIVHDTGSDITSGNFKVTTVSGFVTLAQDWLSTLDLNGPKASLLAMSRDGYQDHVFEVPTPGAAGLMLTGATLFGVRRRRRIA